MVLRVTRNVRVFPGIFELPTVQADIMASNLDTVTALFRKGRADAEAFQQLGAEEQARAFDRGDGRCRGCGERGAVWVRAPSA